MTRRLTRRDLLRSAAAGAVATECVATFRARAAKPKTKTTSANEKLNIAVVGCGGQGAANIRGLAGENIVALCDVDAQRARGAFKHFTKAKKYADFRKMLDEMHKQIDAVVVSTPDHLHAAVALAAMRLAKGVYCEKPLTWSPAEARLMAETARKHKVATQMGTQGMARDASRTGVEIVRSGALGAVRELHVWTDRAKGVWPQGVDRQKGTPPVPAHLNWDLWLGPAPQRPYNPAYAPFKWRGWLDFGTGAIGDMGIHNAAMPFMGLRLGAPTSAEIVECSPRKTETFPAWSKLKIEFPKRGEKKKLPPVTMYWYDGGKKPSVELIGGGKLAGNGAIIVGEKGTMYSIGWTGGDWLLLPEKDFAGYKPPAATLPRAPGQSHHREWIDACKGGPPALCNFIDFAAPITELMLVGNLALRTGQKIQWDSPSLQAPHCPQATPFIKRHRRKGWEL